MRGKEGWVEGVKGGGSKTMLHLVGRYRKGEERNHDGYSRRIPCGGLKYGTYKCFPEKRKQFNLPTITTYFEQIVKKRLALNLKRHLLCPPKQFFLGKKTAKPGPSFNFFPSYT